MIAGSGYTDYLSHSLLVTIYWLSSASGEKFATEISALDTVKETSIYSRHFKQTCLCQKIKYCENPLVLVHWGWLATSTKDYKYVT